MCFTRYEKTRSGSARKALFASRRCCCCCVDSVDRRWKEQSSRVGEQEVHQEEGRGQGDHLPISITIIIFIRVVQRAGLRATRLIRRAAGRHPEGVRGRWHCCNDSKCICRVGRAQ